MHKIDLTTSTEKNSNTEIPESENTTVDPQSSLDNNQRPADISAKNTNKTMPKSSKSAFVIAAVIAIAAGVGTGFAASKLYAESQGLPSGEIEKVATGTVQNGDVFGSPDTGTFKDSAEGYLQAGGLDNEGTHHLLREGGPSQTVYLTSSVTDLSKLEGMEVEVWGETFKGQKAGWLMDVGRVQVVEVNGEKPAEEE